MSTLVVPGAQIWYEVNGSGPCLLLVAGASGTGESFRPLIPTLAAHYQVVTYDRRGFSRSLLDGPQDDAQRLATDADDLRRLIEHLTDHPAMVFGNSSGATVALEALLRTPEPIQIVVAHEPPIARLLPDAETWFTFFDGVYDTYRAKGIPAAMRQFADGVLGDADRQELERAQREHPFEANARYWFEHELRQYPRTEFAFAALQALAGRIMLAGGRDSHNQMTYQPIRVLANQLGQEIIDFPGGHLGFIAAPTDFAITLTDALSR